MKNLTCLLMVMGTFTFSCQKNVENHPDPGKTENMVVRNYDLSVKANFSDTEPQKTIGIDLNSDNQTDLVFISFQDSISSRLCTNHTEDELEAMNYQEENYPVSSISVKILNNNLSLAVQEHSDQPIDIQSSYEEIELDGESVFMTNTTLSNCIDSGNLNDPRGSYTLQSFVDAQSISDKQLFVNSVSTETEEFTIYRGASNFTHFWTDNHTDGKIGETLTTEENCFNVPQNELRYFMFKMNDQWGWISFEISDQNQISIFASAISEE